MFKYNVRDRLAALVKPLSTLVAKSHRLLSILEEATVAMKLYPLDLDWSFQSHQLRWEGLISPFSMHATKCCFIIV